MDNGKEHVRLMRPWALYVRLRCLIALLTWMWEMYRLLVSSPLTCNRQVLAR
jgi:hypothetical protein